ncbi:unnamed protein product [Amoebophrya sp. A120]|nr:unnamed protein product [Amoebophrya sp. A120]|eukprot:GSA120T00002807001.1
MEALPPEEHFANADAECKARNFKKAQRELDWYVSRLEATTGKNISSLNKSDKFFELEKKIRKGLQSAWDEHGEKNSNDTAGGFRSCGSVLSQSETFATSGGQGALCFSFASSSSQEQAVASKTDSGCAKIGNQSSSSSSTLVVSGQAGGLAFPSGENKPQSRRDRAQDIIERLKKYYHEKKLASRILLPGGATTKEELLAFWKSVFKEATSAAREIDSLYEQDADEHHVSDVRRADLQQSAGHEVDNLGEKPGSSNDIASAPTSSPPLSPWTLEEMDAAFEEMRKDTGPPPVYLIDVDHVSDVRRADLRRQEQFQYTVPVTADETRSTACTTASEHEEAEKINSRINEGIPTERAGSFRRQIAVFLTTEVIQGPWTIEMCTADGRELGTLFDHGDGQPVAQSAPLAPKSTKRLTCRSFVFASRPIDFEVRLDYEDRHTETVEETITQVAQRDAARLAQRLAEELQKALRLTTGAVQPVTQSRSCGRCPYVFGRFIAASRRFELSVSALFALHLVGTAERPLIKCEIEMEETNKVSGDSTIYKAYSESFPVVFVGAREGDRSALDVQLKWRRGGLQPEPSHPVHSTRHFHYELESYLLMRGNLGTDCVFTQDDITRTGNQIELRIPNVDAYSQTQIETLTQVLSFGPAVHSTVGDQLKQLLAASPVKGRFLSVRFTFPIVAWAEEFLDLVRVKNAGTVRREGIGMDASSSSTISGCLRTVVEKQIKDCIENSLPPHPWVYALATSPGYQLFETHTAVGTSPQILWRGAGGRANPDSKWISLLATILVARANTTSVRDHDSNNSTPSNNNRENSFSSPHTSEHFPSSSPTKSDRSGRDGTEEEDKTIRLTLYASSREEEEEE